MKLETLYDYDNNKNFEVHPHYVKSNEKISHEQIIKCCVAIKFEWIRNFTIRQ